MLWGHNCVRFEDLEKLQNLGLPLSFEPSTWDLPCWHLAIWVLKNQPTCYLVVFPEILEVINNNEHYFVNKWGKWTSGFYDFVMPFPLCTQRPVQKTFALILSCKITSVVILK